MASDVTVFNKKRKKDEYCPHECLIRASGGEFFRRLKDSHPEADITLDQNWRHHQMSTATREYIRTYIHT